jgi:hypothetical protein
MARACAAQTFRLDRTKPLICSAAELVPFRAVLEWNFEQSSPPRCVRICSASAVTPSLRVMRDAALAITHCKEV